MRQAVFALFLLTTLFFTGCSSVLKQPAIDEVKTVALVSAYMNKEFYNIKSPQAAEGNAAFNALLEAAGAAVADKLGVHNETDPLDEIDPEQMKILAYGVKSYLDEFGELGRWQILPLDQVLQNNHYREMKQGEPTSTLGKFFSVYLSEREKAKWVTPIGFNLVTVASIFDSETAQAGRQAMSELCRELGVDAVALLYLDMGYRFNKLAKITLGTRTLAVPSVAAQLVVVNKRGEIAVDTGAVSAGGGDRYTGDTVGMVKGDVLILQHKEDKAVNSYNLALKKSAAGMRQTLAKAYEKL